MKYYGRNYEKMHKDVTAMSAGEVFWIEKRMVRYLHSEKVCVQVFRITSLKITMHLF